MTKNVKYLLAVAFCCLLSASAFAWDFHVDNFYFNKTSENTVAVTFGEEKYKGDIVIPERITVDGTEYQVTAIDSAAFRERMSSQNKITSVTLHSGIRRIGPCAFEQCWGLTAVTLPEGVERVDSAAFCNCVNNKELSLPSTLKSIGPSAFDTNWLTTVTLPEGLEHIGCNAFVYNKLTEVVIPSTVSRIDGGSFSGYENELKTIRVADGNPYYHTTDGCGELIETATNKLVQGTSHTVVPDYVTEIGAYAFDHCNIKELILPASVSKIDYYALHTKEGIKNLYCFRDTPPETDPCAFGTVADGRRQLKGSITLYVPKGSKEYYQDAPQWKDVKEIVEMNAASIVAAEADQGTVRLYSPDGKQNRYPVKGLNIVRKSDGQSMKIMIK